MGQELCAGKTNLKWARLGWGDKSSSLCTMSYTTLTNLSFLLYERRNCIITRLRSSSPISGIWTEDGWQWQTIGGMAIWDVWLGRKMCLCVDNGNKPRYQTQTGETDDTEIWFLTLAEKYGGPSPKESEREESTCISAWETKQGP